MKNAKSVRESKLKNFLYYLTETGTENIIELIHIDTIQYSDENKYFFSIMDDYSRYGWVFCVKSKVDVYPTIIK
jgi:hypothetical protein